jgi:hypothetical protein
VTREEMEEALKERKAFVRTKLTNVTIEGPLPDERLYTPEVIEAAMAAIADPNNPAYHRRVAADTVIDSYVPNRDQFESPEHYQEFLRYKKYRERLQRGSKNMVAEGFGQLPEVTLPDLDRLPMNMRHAMAASVTGDDAVEEEAMRQWDAENPIDVKTQE